MEEVAASEAMQVASMAYANLWITDAVLKLVIASHPHRNQLIDAIREQIAIAIADSTLVLVGTGAPELSREFSVAAENWLSALDLMDGTLRPPAS